ncbi:energy-coupling factor transporter transmembrane component T [Lutispora thermophila]|uniref:Energy-coupling factor transport system permease protein n=1 Tax=Lutispora thermophila DSM 19022 TaxID=1122184 RepID=A0A1M6D594_9FIRM|nr:energy-coupling factor transporter transmembrane component T [Lutispora thermophila]SHI68264.1 energy-coupling factor transport system permease protein [Lutispora thermophila DSM 19022]
MIIDSFSSFHPIVNFTYFSAVLLFSMFFMHPVFLGISLVSAFVYSVMLKGKKAVKFNILYMMPLLLFMAILNPAFNHQGVTILFYLKSGNPITLESILFGVASACMFVTVILWFSCYNAVMTSDKFIYLFGRIIPGLSLILSMVLRFVPRYTAQIKVISNAQKCVGRDVTQGNVIAKARNGIKILSIMTTWALENAIETGDSMRARGYGLPKRTSFSIFRFDNRDKVTFAVMAGLIVIVLIGAVMGENTMRFFPSIKTINTTIFSLVVYTAYFILCMLPVIINIMEEIKWKYIVSRI